MLPTKPCCLGDHRFDHAVGIRLPQHLNRRARVHGRLAHGEQKAQNAQIGVEKLLENVRALLEVIIRAKPPTSKGVYLKSIALSTTMGPGVKIDPLSVRTVMK